MGLWANINSTNLVGDLVGGYPTNPIQGLEMVNMTKSQPAAKARLNLQAPCSASLMRG